MLELGLGFGGPFGTASLSQASYSHAVRWKITVVSNNYYGYANADNKGTYKNHITIRSKDLEARILSSLKGQLLVPIWR
jgi:hypothetical protein